MSMSMLTIIQFMGIFCAYSFMTVILPEIVLHTKLRGRKLTEQFFISFLTGNFYLINLVLYLELFHIANRITLYLGVFLPAVAVWAKLNHVPFRQGSREIIGQLKKLSEGKLGLKTFLHRILDSLWKGIRKLWTLFCRVVINKPLQWLFVFIILSALFWVYGRQMLIAYGYAASDIPVHMQWINDMCENHLFSDGVYPFGFHCTIYYLHEMFGIDVYVLMRLFFFVQVIYLYLILLGFLKLCCKSMFLPYAALIFIVCGYFANHTYSRFLSSLPQEFGMIFILPAIYFAFLFFEEQRAGKKTKLSLCCFAMSFSLTLAIHFYGTIVAGIFCVGIAIGYFWLFVRKGYFFRLLATGIVSVLIAVLPMGIAYATGTPLQGSLNWAMGVMEGSGQKQQDTKEEVTQKETEDLQEQPVQSETNGQETVTENQPQQTKSEETDDKGVSIKGLHIMEKMEKVSQKLDNVCDILEDGIGEFILNQELAGAVYILIDSILLLGIAGVFLWLLHRREYGAMLLSVAIFFFLLSVLLNAGSFHMPRLMDGNRTSVYYAYLYPIVPVLLCDSLLCLFLDYRKTGWLKNLCSLVLMVGACYVAITHAPQKVMAYGSDYVTNEVITCLTNIIQEEEDGTWTICSSNDETEMVMGHGYHYEIIDFLWKMEYSGEKAEMRIPTKTVYFFIEKRPLNYSVTYSGSGQNVSEKGAAYSIPEKNGILMYQGEYRWIIMSRMYYWAQKFQSLYPDEMKVYLETDTFVCYKIEQNMYSLYNFAIDYGYNHVE